MAQTKQMVIPTKLPEDAKALFDAYFSNKPDELQRFKNCISVMPIDFYHDDSTVYFASLFDFNWKCEPSTFLPCLTEYHDQLRFEETIDDDDLFMADHNKKMEEIKKLEKIFERSTECSKEATKTKLQPKQLDFEKQNSNTGNSYHQISTTLSSTSTTSTVANPITTPMVANPIQLNTYPTTPSPSTDSMATLMQNLQQQQTRQATPSVPTNNNPCTSSSTTSSSTNNPFNF